MKTSLEDLVARIQEKPGLYIGWPSVTRLRVFLDGYTSAIYDQTGNSEWKIMIHRFQNMLHTKHPDTRSMGWDGVLISLAGDEKRGLSMFWILWSEFLQQPKDAYRELPPDDPDI